MWFWLKLCFMPKKEIEEWEKSYYTKEQYERACLPTKLLLVGAEGSGKSTFLQQLRSLYENGQFMTRKNF